MALQLVTAEEMRALEQASLRKGVSVEKLMDTAGLAVAERVRALNRFKLGRALVLVGPGNNGGDGLVCAAHLREWGWEVCLHLTPQRERDAKRFPVLTALNPGP